MLRLRGCHVDSGLNEVSAVSFPSRPCHLARAAHLLNFGHAAQALHKFSQSVDAWPLSRIVGLRWYCYIALSDRSASWLLIAARGSGTQNNRTRSQVIVMLS